MTLVRKDPFPAPVELQLFGGASILVDGQPPTKLPARKVYAIFAALALSPVHRCARVRIASDIWPEIDAENLRMYNLRRALTAARKLISPHIDLLTQPAPEYVQLNLDLATIDVITFDEFAASQDLARVEAAVRLYRGPLLAGFDDLWITHERQKRQSAYLRCIALLRSAARASNDIRRLIELCRLAIKVDPTLEGEQRELIAALADSGDVDAASKAYKNYARALKRQLGLEPEAEIQDMHRRIVTGAWQKDPTLPELSARAPVSVGVFNRPITPILGRSVETQKLCALVRANRLVTITAAGGFGKTRLSLHLAERMNSEFEGGIWFVDLAPVTDPQFVLRAIMDCFDVKELPGVSRLQALRAHLQSLRTLIILDNCEHLRDGCASAALSLLTASAQLHVLATSRQSLGVTGEALFRLGPLASPDLSSSICTALSTDPSLAFPPELAATGPSDALAVPPGLAATGPSDALAVPPGLAATGPSDALTVPPGLVGRELTNAFNNSIHEQFPALSLFVQRAISHGAFKLTPGNIAAVGRICAKLEGNALALEIAAAQTRTYSAEDLDSSLDDMFGVLVSKDPTVQPRQRTLGGLIAWSFDLLPENEACLLARLSVFRGSWTLATAAEICCGEAADRKSIPTLVSNLVDKSLVETIVSDSAGASTSMRFRLLDMVRMYAHDALNAMGKHDEHPGREVSRITDRYLTYHLDFAQRLKKMLTTNDQPQALDMMEQERDNLRVALEYSIAAGDAISALRLANSMWRYWEVRGYYSEGLTWFDRALNLTAGVDLELLCESHFYAGNIAYSALRLSDARAYFERSIEHGTDHGDPVLTASAQASIALILESEGFYNEALELLNKSVEVLNNNGKVFLAAVCQSNIGNNYVGLGDPKRAIEFYREAISTFRSYSHTTDFTHAMVSYSEALAVNEEVEQAIATLREAIPVILSLGSVKDLNRALLVYVCISVQRASMEDAAFLLGTYSSHTDKHRLTPTILQKLRHDRDLAAARAALGSRFQVHFDRGYELPVDELQQHLLTTFH